MRKAVKEEGKPAGRGRFLHEWGLHLASGGSAGTGRQMRCGACLFCSRRRVAQFGAMDAKKRKNLDLSTKADIIRWVEAGEKKSSVAEAFGIPRSTLSTILRNKADVKAKAAQCGRSGACRVCVPEYDKVEKAPYAWFLETRAKNIPVDGSMLMEKAKCFATALGEDDFTGGTGWQQRFKNRHGIVRKTLSGESGATSSNSSIEKWLYEEWPDIFDSFLPS